MAAIFFLRFFLSDGFDLLYHAVEITCKQPILHDAVFVVFAFGMGFGQLGRYLSRVLQNPPVPEFQEARQPFFPVFNGHGDFAHGLKLGHIEVGGDDALNLRQFELGEIVLGDGDIVSMYFPRGVRLPNESGPCFP